MQIIYSMGGMTFPSTHGYKESLAVQHTPEVLRDLFTNHGAVLVLEGGADISPSLYGQQNRHSSCSLYRDQVEVELYEIAKECNAPVLGICRGHQLVAALEGGTLFQDLDAEGNGWHPYRHSITLTQAAIDSGFAKLMESCPVGSGYVNSLHHQGINRMPASGTILGVYDELVEAVLYPRALTMQWHPELLGHIEVLHFMADYFKV